MMKKIINQTLKQQGLLPEITCFKGMEAFNNICPEIIKKKYIPLFSNNAGELMSDQHLLSPLCKNESVLGEDSTHKYVRRCLSRDSNRSPKIHFECDSSSQKECLHGIANSRGLKRKLNEPIAKFSKKTDPNLMRILNRESIERNYKEISRRIRHKVRDERIVYRK
jgi:hypothetical protein